MGKATAPGLPFGDNYLPFGDKSDRRQATFGRSGPQSSRRVSLHGLPVDEDGVGGGAQPLQAKATAAVPDDRLARSALGVVWNQRWQLLVRADCSL